MEQKRARLWMDTLMRCWELEKAAAIHVDQGDRLEEKGQHERSSRYYEVAEMLGHNHDFLLRRWLQSDHGRLKLGFVG